TAPIVKSRLAAGRNQWSALPRAAVFAPACPFRSHPRYPGFMARLRALMAPLVLLGPVALGSLTVQARAGGGELRMTVIDKKTGELVPCRMHLKTAAGKPRPQRPFPYWYDHFVFPGKIKH